MGRDARQAIIDEDAKLGITPTLPPQVPFGSHQWPMAITSAPGANNTGRSSLRPKTRVVVPTP